MTYEDDLEHVVDTPEPDDLNQAETPAASPTNAAGEAAEPDATEPDTAGPESVGELLQVHPAELIVGLNVRLDPRLDKEFIRSVRDRGVREPITARRRDDGRLVVRKGMRRTLAAVQTDRPWVPVLVEPDPEQTDPGRAEQVERIVDQLEENVHRAGNTDVEVVAAHQELLDLGLSAGQIARRTHTAPKRVKVTTAVARSARATAALAEYDIPLDRAAVIAEFDDDTEDGTAAVAALTTAATEQPHQFDHVAQRLRDRRDDARLVAEHRAELTAAEVHVIDVDDDGNGGTLLSGLRPSLDDPAGTELTVEGHGSCPGHAADVAVHRSFDRVPQVRTRYWCTDPTGHGHAPRWTTTSTPTGTDPTGTDTNSSNVSGAGQRQGGMSEQEKAQRRRVIENNRQWESATTVRQRWLRQFLARKTPPKDAAVAIAAVLATGGHDLRRALESRHLVARELFGLPAPRPGEWPPAPNPLIDAARTAATPARATMITLGVVLGAGEAGTSRDSWRHPTDDTRSYFTLITGWGYEASEVEQLVLNQPDTDIDSDDNDRAATSPVDGLAEPADGRGSQCDNEPDLNGSTPVPVDAGEHGGEVEWPSSESDEQADLTEQVDHEIEPGPDDVRVA